MLQRIEYARREALKAREKARECIDNNSRDAWETAAGMWDQIVKQYELLLNITETVKLD